MNHTLPELMYAYDALEPYIDAKTMEIHYTKHHQAYIDKLNAVLENYADLQEMAIEDVLRQLPQLQISDQDKTMIRNHGGGHANHTLFWEILGPKKEINEHLVSEIKQTFGSVESFRERFSDMALKQFGSGWAWLVRNQQNALEIYATPNQDSPFMRGDVPIIGLDVWEHAYYLKYQNKRAEYIENWWHVLTLI